MQLNTCVKTITMALLGAACITFLAPEAAAWGDRAQRVITTTAIKEIRTRYAGTFKAGRSDYFGDVIRGATDGWPEYRDSAIYDNPEAAIGAVGREIRIMRDVRNQGAGSYFAYRMGMLSSLVSSIVMPYGLDTDPQGANFRQQIFGDIDSNLEQFQIEPIPPQPEFIQLVSDYFRPYREFIADDRIMIAADYRAGSGFDGILRQSAQQYFQNAIMATVDVWHTVLTGRNMPNEARPSPEALTWFHVDQIGYLLGTKRNEFEAKKAYTQFAAVNPGLMEAYEEVGDYFYQFGDAQDGVREWEFALSYSGPSRRRVVEKLADHYLGVGEKALEEAGGDARVRDVELERALRAFERAYSFDSTNQLAAQQITETNVAIREREEARQLAISFMASAESVTQQARQFQAAEDYGQAITTYRAAINTFELVDPNFPDQYDAAENNVKDINKEIRSIIIDLLDRGNEAIAAGDNALDERRFQEAIAQYERVPMIVGDVPDDESSAARDKQELIDKAEEKVRQARIEQKRWEELQAQQQQQAQQPQ